MHSRHAFRTFGTVIATGCDLYGFGSVVWMYAIQVPVIDTKSCTANFRTNSFVGTEGASRGFDSLFVNRVCSLTGGLFHCWLRLWCGGGAV